MKHRNGDIIPAIIIKFPLIKKAFKMPANAIDRMSNRLSSFERELTYVKAQKKKNRIEILKQKR